MLYVELDFPEITSRKAALIRKSPLLQRVVAGKRTSWADAEAAAAAAGASGAGGASPPTGSPPTASVEADVAFTPTLSGGCDVTGGGYRLRTADLRDVGAVAAALGSCGLVRDAPTLFLSECVLVYLEPEESCAIIAWAARSFSNAAFATYEQIRPHDAFGLVMARNLEERGFALRGLHAFPDLPAQLARYKELGWSGVSAADMNDGACVGVCGVVVLLPVLSLTLPPPTPPTLQCTTACCPAARLPGWSVWRFSTRCVGVAHCRS